MHHEIYYMADNTSEIYMEFQAGLHHQIKNFHSEFYNVK